MPDDLKRCPYCAEPIQAAAVKCRFCHEYMDEELRLERNAEQAAVNGSAPYPNGHAPGLALVLGLIGPGFGQFYEERIAAGLGYMLLVVVFAVLGTALSPFFLLPAGLAHLFAAREAYLHQPMLYPDEYDMTPDSAEPDEA